MEEGRTTTGPWRKTATRISNLKYGKNTDCSVAPVWALISNGDHVNEYVPDRHEIEDIGHSRAVTKQITQEELEDYGRNQDTVPVYT